MFNLIIPAHTVAVRVYLPEIYIASMYTRSHSMSNRKDCYLLGLSRGNNSMCQGRTQPGPVRFGTVHNPVHIPIELPLASIGDRHDLSRRTAPAWHYKLSCFSYHLAQSFRSPLLVCGVELLPHLAQHGNLEALTVGNRYEWVSDAGLLLVIGRVGASDRASRKGKQRAPTLVRARPKPKKIGLLVLISATR